MSDTTPAPKSAAQARKAATPKAAKPPTNGYVLLDTTCPAREGSSRALRWPLIVRCSGKEDGRTLLATALEKGGFNQSAAGTLRWLVGAGLAKVD